MVPCHRRSIPDGHRSKGTHRKESAGSLNEGTLHEEDGKGSAEWLNGNLVEALVIGRPTVISPAPYRTRLPRETSYGCLGTSRSGREHHEATDQSTTEFSCSCRSRPRHEGTINPS
jgi:hypothetical protein